MRKSLIYIPFLLLFTTLNVYSVSQEDCTVLEYKTFVKVEKGKLIKERSITIQVNNKEADWISDVDISYKDSEKLELLEAAILNKSNVVERELKKKEIVTRSDISSNTFYQDRYVKEFKLKWHQYPYRIRYRYRTTTDQFLFVANWHPILYLGVPVQNASLEVQIPKEYEIFINASKSIDHVMDDLGEMYSYQWKTNYLKQIKSETFGENIMDLIPKVLITPEKFEYQQDGSMESWQSFGEWQSRVIEHLDDISSSEAAEIEAITNGISDKRALIKKLYNYLQDNTRYINVSIDEGGMVPYPASYVFSNKYGDCKALTIYMKAMLRHVGIDSFYTLIYAGSNPSRIDQNFPSQQFNHVILCVPLEKDTVWLENTSGYFPYNYLGTFTQNRYGLLVDGTNSKLIKTPSLSLDEVRDRCNYHFSLDEEGNGDLKITQDVQGVQFEKYIYMDEDLSPREKDRQIRRSFEIDNIDQISYQIQHEERDKPYLNFSANLQLKDQFRRLGNSMVIPIFPLYQVDLESSTSRVSDVKVNYPINKSDSIVYDFPFAENMHIKIPSNTKVSSRFGNYEESYFIEGNQIHVTRNFQLFAGQYPVEEYTDFYSFFKRIDDAQRNSNIVLNPR